MKAKVKSRPLTENEYLIKLKKVHGDKYSFVGKYVNMNVKTKFKTLDGIEFEVTPKELLNEKFSIGE